MECLLASFLLPHSSSLRISQKTLLHAPRSCCSSRQARSLFSHSKTKQTSLQYYALDFGGEGSAFYGDRLWRQARFVNAAIRTLQSIHGIQGTPHFKGVSVLSIVQRGHALPEH